MKVRDVMSRKTISVRHDTKLRELWKTIFQKHVNSVPVVDPKGKLLGIITKDDILKLLYPDYSDLVEDFFSVTDFEEMENRISALGSKSARDIMKKRVVFTRESTPIMRALSRMIVRRVSQLPVLSERDEVVGILTKGDVFYALFRSKVKEKLLKFKA